MTFNQCDLPAPCSQSFAQSSARQSCANDQGMTFFFCCARYGCCWCTPANQHFAFLAETRALVADKALLLQDLAHATGH